MDRGLPGAAWWRAVAKARLRCNDPACGLAGPNPDARFGRWVSENFTDTHWRTLLNARRLWEVFGQRREEVVAVMRTVGAVPVPRAPHPGPALPAVPWSSSVLPIGTTEHTLAAAYRAIG